MKYANCEAALKAGKKIKLKSWKNAYWYVNEDGVTMNHDEDGVECPSTELFPRDLLWVMKGDWEVIEDGTEREEAPVSEDADIKSGTIDRATYKKAVLETVKQVGEEQNEAGLLMIAMMVFAAKLEDKLFN